jgi:hypothetical protein
MRHWDAPFSSNSVFDHAGALLDELARRFEQLVRCLAEKEDKPWLGCIRRVYRKFS